MSYETDEEDDWFFNSIKRYEDLLIFDLQGIPRNATFSNEEKVILTSNRGSTNEVLELSLPDRLLIDKNESGLKRNRDFKIQSSGYCKGKACQVISHSENIIVSERHGVELYSLKNPESDVISSVKTLRGNIFDPHLTLHKGGNESKINVLSATSLKDVESYDLSSEKVESLNLSKSLEGSSILSKLECVGSSLFCGFQNRGELHCFDFRTNDNTQVIKEADGCGDRWSYCVSSNCDIFALASSSNDIKVYDNRNILEPLFKFSLESYKREENNNISLQFEPHSSNFLSISGLDKSIYILSLKDLKDEPVFVHDGHKRNCSLVTFHMWHPTIAKLIMSGDDNSTMQAWKFNL